MSQPPLTAVGASPPLHSAHSLPPPPPPTLRQSAAHHMSPQQPSPTMPATSPTMMHGSPMSGPNAPSYPAADAHRRPNDTPRSRSSVACYQCRRSKVRCANNGPNTPCENCRKANRECAYPPPGGTATSSVRRPSLSAHEIPLDRVGEGSRKRRRAAPSASYKDSPQAESSLCNPSLFTSKVWKELFEIFKHQYAADLPFLHEASFIPMLEDIDTDISALPDSRGPLVLAFISLTVIFHKGLVRQLSTDSKEGNFHLSRQYADIAERRLRDTHGYERPTIESTQTLLMLGLRAHGNCQGSKSYIMIGDAISSLHIIDCHIEPILDQRPFKTRVADPKNDPDYDSLSEDDRLIADEIKRRTFWSCFIIDVYLSSGNYRPRRIHIEDTLVQLPCNDEAFELGVMTRMLHETQDEFNIRKARTIENDSKYADYEWEDESSQGPLVWFIKALDLYGDVMHWGLTITRRNETVYPWEGGEQSGLNYYKLNARLEDLIDKLPARLKLNPKRTDYWITRRTTLTTYVLLHATQCMCEIVLQREWLPFLPNSKSLPGGPIDGPNVDSLRRYAPPGFWLKSASKCFKATKAFTDLMWTCLDRGVPVETPFTAFVMYTITCTIVWCHHFPNQDHEGHLSDGKVGKGRAHSNKNLEERIMLNLGRAYNFLDHLQSRVAMARPWCKLTCDWWSHIRDCKRTNESHARDAEPGSPETPASDSTENSDVGGLTRYQQFERVHKAFSHEAKNPVRHRDPIFNAVSATFKKLQEDMTSRSSIDRNSLNHVKSEDRDSLERTPGLQAAPSGGFKSINSVDPVNSHQPHTSWSGTSPPSSNGHLPPLGPLQLSSEESDYSNSLYAPSVTYAANLPDHGKAPVPPQESFGAYVSTYPGALPPYSGSIQNASWNQNLNNIGQGTFNFVDTYPPDVTDYVFQDPHILVNQGYSSAVGQGHQQSQFMQPPDSR